MSAASQSETINELAAALAKAQGEMEDAEKTRDNPFFKSRYATLAAVWAACRAQLSANGLAVAQPATADGARVTVGTILMHASGQWLRCEITAQAKDAGPQSVGSVISYLRRYQLASMVGVATEDDDGEAGHGRGDERDVVRPSPSKSVRSSKPAQQDPPTSAQAALDMDALKAALLKAFPGEAGQPRRHAWMTAKGCGDAKHQFKHFVSWPAERRKAAIEAAMAADDPEPDWMKEGQPVPVTEDEAKAIKAEELAAARAGGWS